MAKKRSWEVEINGAKYTINYRQSNLTGNSIISVNGNETTYNHNGRQYISGVDVPIDINGKELHFVRYNGKADLAVDGYYLDSKKEYKPFGKIPWWGWLTSALSLTLIIATNFSIFWILISLAGAMSCIRLSVNPNIKRRTNILLCFGILFSVYFIFLIAVVITMILILSL